MLESEITGETEITQNIEIDRDRDNYIILYYIILETTG